MIREVKENELETLLALIKEMAEYEKLTKEVTATIKTHKQSIFIEKGLKACFIEEEKIVGYLLYFYNYSSFTGTANIYIEDIFVKEAYRKKGYGQACFKYLAKEALKINAKRIDWVCLDWNEKSLAFYQKMGAKKLDCWVLHRLDEEAIKKLAS